MQILLCLIVLLFSVSCENKETQNSYPFATNFVSKHNAIPVISVKINGYKTKFIIDTGSEINVINTSFYHRHPDSFELIESNFMQIQTINGSVYEENYIVNTFLNDTVPITFNVMNINSAVDNIFINQQDYIDGIIGVDFLYRNGLVLDFKNNIITKGI